MRHEAINNLYPNVASQTNDLVFDSEGNKINVDEAKVAEEVIRLEAEYKANQYQRDRVEAYPTWQEQLDLQYWDKVNGTNKWQETVAKVKADNPKPN